MKGKVSNILLVLIFVAGLSLLLYPTISNYYNAYLQSQIIADYSQQVDEMDAEANALALSYAQRYNALLNQREDPYHLTPELEELYWNLLRTTDDEIMAYVHIPSIEVTLPIAHGTEDPTLKKNVGHMKWSSLPVGGESTHSVISAHRGLPSAELFTNIDHLERGDMFYIHVLGQTLEYMVDHIAVVEPYDYTLLTVTEGKDYVTLMTCTPYGINSHRLLVRGVRIGTAEQESQSLIVKNEVTQIDLRLIMTVSLGTLAALSFLLQAMLTRTRKRKERKPDET
ncbi:MAG: class C sortase [Oscillospiraceae bacterium]|nr:class C sortase [Oscillospiraceae bacterium]